MANGYYWCPGCGDMMDSDDPLDFCKCDAKWEVQWHDPKLGQGWGKHILGRFETQEEAEVLAKRLTPEDEPRTHLFVVSVHPTGIVVPGSMPKWDLWRENDGTICTEPALPWAHSTYHGPHGAQLFARTRQEAIDKWTEMYSDQWEHEKTWRR